MIGAALGPGKSLRAIRERLRLKYRDVEEATILIAGRNKNPEFIVGLSRLADIENKGTVPSVYRMYSLATVYGLDYSDVAALYGISFRNMPGDAAALQLDVTKPVNLRPPAEVVDVPLKILTALDFRKNAYVGREIRAWGKLPLHFLDTINSLNHCYAMVGHDDWSMYPLIPPGSFVQVDATKRKVSNGGWDNDFTRPIYFLELRQGYRFGWCTERAGTLIVQPHSSAPLPAEVFKHPGEIEVVGQVVGVAMRLDRVKRRHKRSSSGPG